MSGLQIELDQLEDEAIHNSSWLQHQRYFISSLLLFVLITCNQIYIDLMQNLMEILLFLQALTLHLEEWKSAPRRAASSAPRASKVVQEPQEGWSTMHTALIAGSAAVVAVAIVLYFRRSNG